MERAFPILSTEKKMAILEEVRPAIEKIMADPKSIWGPKRVTVMVETADGDKVGETYGTVEGWDEESWGHYLRFGDIAMAKLKTVKASGEPSRLAGEYSPFLLPEGGCLWGGALCAPGIWVAASGLTEEADEIVANIVLQAFLEAARAEVARRRKTDDESEMILGP